MATNEIAHSINKETLKQYLHDVQQIECDIRTLKLTFTNAWNSHKDFSDYWLKGGFEKAIDDIVKRFIDPLNSDLARLEREISDYNTKITNERNALEQKIKIQTIEANKKFRIGYIFGGLGIGIVLTPPLLALLTLVVIVPLVLLGIHFDPVIGIILPIFIPIIFGIISTIAFIHLRKDKTKVEQNKLSKLKHELDALEQEYQEETMKYAQTKADIQANLDDCYKQIREKEQMKPQQVLRINLAFEALRPQFDHINNQVAQLEKQRDSLYAMNILPPDYQSLECVIALSQIYRNDLADNMRDAILLYEERLFRGEMIRGLERIADSIDKLGGLMQETVVQLKRCNETASKFSSNLINVSYSIKENTVQMEKIAEQFESNNFINTSIKNNTERLVWYEDQRRMGLF